MFLFPFPVLRYAPDFVCHFPSPTAEKTKQSIHAGGRDGDKEIKPGTRGLQEDSSTTVVSVWILIRPVAASALFCAPFAGLISPINCQHRRSRLLARACTQLGLAVIAPLAISVGRSVLRKKRVV